MGRPRLPAAHPGPGPRALTGAPTDLPEHAFGRRDEAPPLDTFTASQVHGTAVVAVAGDPPAPTSAEGDAVVTDAPGVAVGVVTADCLPVLLANGGGHVVAAVHAGWRGTLGGVAPAAVAAIQSRFGTEPGDLVALLGPCIRPCCYEVGPEVSAAVRAAFPRWADRVLVPGPGGRDHLDLVTLNALQLAQAGVRDVRDSGGCTKCDPARYHSYRRDGPGAGRMVSWVRAAG
jgi:purine-nucleoside/S-methyl-5'-thioadenosine phosphorylase / adenosine deaminase